jgi:hypothetical protein
MALVPSDLEDGLLSAFQSMTDGDNSVFADNVASLIKDYAESGSISTTDAGTVSAGTFTGVGSGGLTCDDEPCAEAILAACVAMNSMASGGDAYLAEHLAAAIDAMIASGTVETSVTGTVTTPSGATSPLSGEAEGSMSGTPATIQTALSSAFTTMRNMTSGGDAYLAEQLANAVDTYLKAATVTTNGKEALSGSTGNGKMS